MPFFLAGYHLTPKKWKNYTLLIFSVLFYAWGAPEFVLILLISSILNFYLVQQINKENNRKKLLLIISVVLNLGLLSYFKYANFFVENFNLALNSLGVASVEWTKIALPIGISFFTFQSLTYSVDVYRGVHKPLNKLSDFLVYILSFPQMIAGPIVRFNEIADEIIDRKETLDDKLYGIYRFSIGLAKKVLIANVLAEYADTLFKNDLTLIDSSQAWIAVLAYTFQIYFDFSGYSDMAIGLGKIMGFTFPENFNAPYVSKNISEFWRRWHITLGNFMRDYLYIPLGGNRVKSKGRLYFNLWIVFLLSGLWHGASWNFVIWGAYHGLFLILDRLFLVKLLNRLGSFVSILFTFFIVVVGWSIFKIEDFENLKLFMGKLFSFDFHSIELGREVVFTFITAILFSFISSFSWGEKMQNFVFNNSAKSIRLNALFYTVSIFLFILSVAAIAGSDFNPFIYFRF